MVQCSKSRWRPTDRRLEAEDHLVRVVYLFYLFIYLFITNNIGRLAPLTCHTVHQTLKSRSNTRVVP